MAAGQDVSGPLTAETWSYDVRSNRTVECTVMDRANKTVARLVCAPDSTNAAAQVTVNGLLVRSSGRHSPAATLYTHDGLSRQTGVTDPRTGTRTTHYDAKGQVDWEGDAAGNRTAYAYDAATGSRVAVTNALGQAARYHYDAQGRLLAAWSNVYPVVYEYDVQGRMTALYVPSGCRLTLFRREEECDGAGGAVQ
jgi:hypothetical protein